MAKNTRVHTAGSRATARRNTKTKGSSKIAHTQHGGSNGSSLRVRMYRHGLGDCFLITLPKPDGAPFYMMIDCGIIVGSPNPSIMEDVVRNIIADTDGFVDIRPRHALSALVLEQSCTEALMTGRARRSNALSPLVR